MLESEKKLKNRSLDWGTAWKKMNNYNICFWIDVCLQVSKASFSLNEFGEVENNIFFISLTGLFSHLGFFLTDYKWFEPNPTERGKWSIHKTSKLNFPNCS